MSATAHRTLPADAPGHTPGPWSVSKGCDQYIGAEGFWIASTMGVRGLEGAANARLIAAAPDLLEVAKSIDTMWSSLDGGGPDNARSGEVRPIWHALRAAIARATVSA